MIAAQAQPPVLALGAAVQVDDPDGGSFTGTIEHVSPPSSMTTHVVYRVRRDAPIVVAGVERTVFWTHAGRVTPRVDEPFDHARFEAQR